MVVRQKKRKALHMLLQQQTKCLILCRICYDNRLDHRNIIAYPDPTCQFEQAIQKNIYPQRCGERIML